MFWKNSFLLIAGPCAIESEEIAFEIVQGIQIIGKYDFFDPKKELLSGAISRYSLGVEIYPLNIIEIKLQARMNKIDSSKKEKNLKPELLIQTHFYF